MNIKETILNSNIEPKNTESISNIKQNGLTSIFNKKTIKIVVAARQYRGGTILSRGYGDVASGVRGLEYLRKIYPVAKFSFVFEHFVDSKEEFLKLKAITTIFEVKTYVLNGRIKNDAKFQSQQWQQEHQENEVNKLLQEADFIFHGPAGLIAPLQHSKGEYAQKTVGVSEYERDTGFYSKDDPHGIANFKMGLYYNRIYLCEPTFHKTQFQDNILRKYCRNPMLNNEINNCKNNFYFHYDHNVSSLAQMVRIMMLIEGDCSKNIVLVSTNGFYIETFKQKDFKNLLLKCCPFQVVKVCGVNNNGKYVELMIYENPQGKHVKNIHLITPTKLSNNDFKLLQKGSIINYSTGDISTSDVLAIGKLPVFGIFTKKCFFTALWDKIKDFCILAGNEQYQDFIGIWALAASNFTRQAKDRFLQKSLVEIKSLQKLRSLKWQAFEVKFTNWLKENNQTESFIREKAEVIIARST
jgi:hypothetical protein